MIASADVRVGDVSGLLLRPADARLLYVLAHGAGAGMRHPFLESLAQRLADRSVATLRYQFPYMERRAGPILPRWLPRRCGPRWRKRRVSRRGCRSSPAANRSAGA